MKILITGASGFLGSWFLNHFLTADQGHDIFYMDIRPHPAGLPIDIEDMESWLASFEEDVDLAFHFAAPVGGRQKIEYDPMYNADAFRLDSVFFRWAVRHAELAIYPSSSAVYPVSLQGRQLPGGFGHGAVLLNEGFQSAQNPNWLAPDELYGFTKLAGEYMAWKAATKHGLSTLVLRPFTGYGPYQTLDYPIPSILTRALRREDPLVIWGSGEQRRDPVYVTDIVGATMARIEAGVEGMEVMNIASGFSHSFLDIARIAADIVGYEPELKPLPDKPMGVFDRRGDPQRMLRYYQPEVSFRQGLEYTIDHLKEGLVVKGPEIVRVP